jgi:hypothetical protein
MLKMLVVDEITNMAKDAADKMVGHEEGGGGASGNDRSNHGKAQHSLKGPMKLGMYSDDEEEVVVA